MLCVAVRLQSNDEESIESLVLWWFRIKAIQKPKRKAVFLLRSREVQPLGFAIPSSFKEEPGRTVCRVLGTGVRV